MAYFLLTKETFADISSVGTNETDITHFPKLKKSLVVAFIGEQSLDARFVVGDLLSNMFLTFSCFLAFKALLTFS